MQKSFLILSTFAQLIFYLFSFDSSCIFPPLNFRFSGSDIDAESLEWAQKNIKLNGNFSDYIDLYKTENCEELQSALCFYSVERGRASIFEKEQSKAKAEAEAEVEVEVEVTALPTPSEQGQDDTEQPNRSYVLGANRVNNVITQCLLSSSHVLCIPSLLLPESESEALVPRNVRLLGPVRSALMASGSHKARIVKTLEKEFVDENCSPLRSRVGGFKVMMKMKADTLSAEHSVEYSEEHSPEHSLGITDIPMERFNSDREELSAEKCERGTQRSEGLGYTGGEGSLYTAVMTNPPFYDYSEQVSIAHLLCRCCL
jgi:hypothetical protein